MSIKRIHHEHDKIMKKILSNKKEAVKFINRTVNLQNKVTPESIEIYNKEYITDSLEIRQADVIYKLKNNNIFFLIEHQSKVDYSIPYRILEYKTEILKYNVDKERMKQKDYKMPLIIAIVLYTGKESWKVEQEFLQVQEECSTYLKEKLGISSFYILEDINKISEEELLKSNNFLEKIFLLEKSKSKEDLKENFIKIIQKLKREEQEGKITKEDKEEFEEDIIKILVPKIGQEEIKEQIEKSREGVEGKMELAVTRMIARENQAIRVKSKREGKIEGMTQKSMEIAKKLFEIHMTAEEVKQITGLTEKEVAKLKK